MPKYTIVCPHCSSTGTHDFNAPNGVQHRQCPSCHKTIKVETYKGEVKRVTK